MTTIYIDCTTTFEERGRHPHGTTRVERGLVAASAHVAGPHAPPPMARQVAVLWRATGAARRPSTMDATVPPPLPADPFTHGAMLFFPGEHHRHDFARLAALKERRELRFAFLFYDLLAVLLDADPRLADPTCAGLPQSDFILGMADLALPISHVSAEALSAHAARRGVVGPILRPIRLFTEPLVSPDRPVPELTPGAFVLSVGDVVDRKNHALLADVWSALGKDAPVLAIAGRVDREGDSLAVPIRRDPVLRGTIRFFPDLADDSLAWLYRNCRFTVFPSRLEGFGLPVAESLAAGKVCVASGVSAIPEAAQGAAILLDPDDQVGWIAAVRRLADDAVLRSEEARVARTFRLVTATDTVAEIAALLR